MLSSPPLLFLLLPPSFSLCFYRPSKSTFHHFYLFLPPPQDIITCCPIVLQRPLHVFVASFRHALSHLPTVFVFLNHPDRCVPVTLLSRWTSVALFFVRELLLRCLCTGGLLLRLALLVLVLSSSSSHPARDLNRASRLVTPQLFSCSSFLLSIFPSHCHVHVLALSATCLIGRLQNLPSVRLTSIWRHLSLIHRFRLSGPA